MRTEIKPHLKSWFYGAAASIPVLLTILAYWPSLGNHFTNWDDTEAILWNPHIRALTPHNLHWMWTTFHLGNWIPLTWLSLALDYRVGKLDPWVYHLDNLFWHCLNTLLVFFLGVRLLKLAVKIGPPEGKGREEWVVWAAFLTALLFGLHPIHVESVAWATERKDLLYAFFFLLSLWVYLDYASGPMPKAGKLTACLGLFLAALGAKPMAVTLPVVFLIVDAWPLGRFQTQRPKVFLEKIPFFLVAAFSVALTSAAQSSAGSVTGLAVVPLDYRAMNLLHSLAFYLGKMIYPAGLAALYPIDLRKTFSLDYVFSSLAAVWIFLVCVLSRKKLPGLMAALAYYLVTLAPVLGIVQVGSQCAADRYTYLPSLAPFLLLGAASARVMAGRRWVLPLAAGALAAFLGLGTLHQTQTWKDTVTLWGNVLRVNPRNCEIPHANLADGLMEAGNLEGALVEFNRAIAIDPSAAYPHDGKGMALLRQGKLEAAEGELKTAVQLEPKNARYLCHLGMAHVEMKKPLDALAEFQESILADPDFAEAYHQVGLIHLGGGKPGIAREVFQKALDLDPDNGRYRADWDAATQNQVETGK